MHEYQTNVKNTANSCRRSNFFLVGHSKREAKANGRKEIISEMIEENFPELKVINLWIKSAQHYEWGKKDTTWTFQSTRE